MIDEPHSPERLSRLLRMTPVSSSEGDPDNRLAFPMDRDVVWDTPEGEKTADRGDARIQDHTPHLTGRQGVLFAPQSVTDYNNTKDRQDAVERIAQHTLDIDESGNRSSVFDHIVDPSTFRKNVRHSLKTSRVPTELLSGIAESPLDIDNDPRIFSGEKHSGMYTANDRTAHLNPHVFGSQKGLDKEFQSSLLHEIGHFIDSHTNKGLEGLKVTPRLEDPRFEGAATGFADRYTHDIDKGNIETDDSKAPDLTSIGGYHHYGDQQWLTHGGQEIFTKMRQHTRDTGAMPKVGEVDFLTKEKPHHMGEQFYQPTLWDD